MTTTQDWSRLAGELTDTLNLSVPPIAIGFERTTPTDVPAFDAPMPDPMEDGRTGRVPAGCVFWMHATERTFSTVAPEQGEVAASVGCALSRARTGMAATEMTCAIPAGKLAEVVGALQTTAAADTTVARYAARDANRFS